MDRPFTIAKWALAWIVLTCAVAMLAYPGGTFLDPSTHVYSFFHNSLSDLGAMVAPNGQTNRVSALVFDFGFGAMLLALVPGFAALIRLYWELPSQRFLTVALVCATLFSCFCLVGIGLSPHDRFRTVHHLFNKLLFLTFPMLLFLLALLTARDPRFSRRAVVGWLFLMIVLVAYGLTLFPAPRISVSYVFHVTSQKVVAVAALFVTLFEIREAEQAARSESATQMSCPAR